MFPECKAPHSAMLFLWPPTQHGEQFVPEGYQLAPGREFLSTNANIVGPAYFDTLAIPIVRGRAFTPSDKEDSPKVAIINEVMAHKYFKGKNAVGRRIRLGDNTAPWAQIVGVAKTSKLFWMGEAPEEFLYLPFQQTPKVAMTLLVHSQGDSSSLAAPLRKLVSQLDSRHAGVRCAHHGVLLLQTCGSHH